MHFILLDFKCDFLRIIWLVFTFRQLKLLGWGHGKLAVITIWRVKLNQRFQCLSKCRQYTATHLVPQPSTTLQKNLLCLKYFKVLTEAWCYQEVNFILKASNMFLLTCNLLCLDDSGKYKGRTIWRTICRFPYMVKSEESRSGTVSLLKRYYHFYGIDYLLWGVIFHMVKKNRRHPQGKAVLWLLAIKI